MGGQFERLLLEVQRELQKTAGAAERSTAANESTLRRLDDVSRDVSELREKVAALVAAKEYTGEDRRAVKERLETGDHTFQRLLTELELEKARAKATAVDVNNLRKSVLAQARRVSSRRFALTLALVGGLLIPMAWEIIRRKVWGP